MFDIFLIHNNEDKAIVSALAEALKAKGMRVSLDNASSDIIDQSKSIAIIVCSKENFPWETAEIKHCIDYAAQHRKPLIPVLMHEAQDKKKLPPFLQRYNYSDLRQGLTSQALAALIQLIPADSPPATKRSHLAENVPHLYPVWFATNREPLDKSDLSKGFQNRRATDLDAVYYGQCEVAIPKTHRFGETGRVWLRRWAALDFKGNDQLSINTINSCRNAADFWQQLQQQFLQNKITDRDAVVFLHGYNNSFEDAAIRAAQIGFDLKIRGYTAFFSWPSMKSTLRYSADGESINASEDAITQFLLDFSEKSGAERIHLIAHSMGNRGLLRALKNITHKVKETDLKIKFGQIILAAPDLDVAIFKKAAYIYPQLSESTTVYASAKDLPVGFSTLLNGNPRLGFVPPVTTSQDIDTIEVNDFDIINLGHAYFSEAEALLTDIFDLIRHGAAPEHRQRPVRQRTEDGQVYWRIDTL